MTLTLPWPPSMNHYYAVVRGRKITSKRGREYQAAVFAIAVHGLSFPAEMRLSVHVTARPPDRRKRDLDNLAKPILDALQKAGVFGDDGQIDDLRIVRAEPSKPGSITVEVSELKGV